MAESRIERELAEIAIATRNQLIERWRRLIKRELPPYASVEFLRFVAAYAVQERALGGLSPTVKRQLVAIARGERPTQATGRIRIKPGSRLLREWHGTTHEVIVTDKGFVWEGRTYKSLSAVAQTISGAKWNGPRFFGLVKERDRTNG
jgi:hypothetical protein